MSPVDVKAIRSSGLKTKELATKYNKSERQIRLIKSNASWKYIVG